MSKKALIIFKSKTGFTEKYARAAADSAGCDVIALKSIGEVNISEYDILVFGGSIHAGIIDGLKQFRKLMNEHKKMSFAVFATGASPAEADTILTMWKGNLSDDELSHIPHFYMQSGLNYEKMGFFDKLLMKLLLASLKSKKNKTTADEAMIKMIAQSYDISSEQFIEPLVDYIQSKS